jgi:hypothetical protein
MNCIKCQEPFTIKVMDEWISLMCDCQCFIMYPDGFIVRKEKKDYNPKYKEQKK